MAIKKITDFLRDIKAYVDMSLGPQKEDLYPSYFVHEKKEANRIALNIQTKYGINDTEYGKMINYSLEQLNKPKSNKQENMQNLIKKLEDMYSLNSEDSYRFLSTVIIDRKQIPRERKILESNNGHYYLKKAALKPLLLFLLFLFLLFLLRLPYRL